ncbi:EGF-like domain protein [Ancylostoma caninum]|uniref:EGF-like domain protein n=1 Tax=Ancylostoma caninum TaxID=29170 RepID=A0A368G0C3_ANCCA|nr:EGF-like domain protein [Ancylostoma caninum]
MVLLIILVSSFRQHACVVMDSLVPTVRLMCARRCRVNMVAVVVRTGQKPSVIACLRTPVFCANRDTILKAVAFCDPPCANGECVIRDDKVNCECKQGFTGTVCNVVDVCFGDAVCSLFGEQAKCVIDEASYTPISSTLYNATYECRCPHPVDGGESFCFF